jgi:hypothetical protein
MVYLRHYFNCSTLVVLLKDAHCSTPMNRDGLLSQHVLDNLVMMGVSLGGFKSAKSAIKGVSIESVGIHVHGPFGVRHVIQGVYCFLVFCCWCRTGNGKGRRKREKEREKTAINLQKYQFAELKQQL